ncbi:MAG: hypothetical protein JNN15_20145 [Blastocatellia bacterium]|nr:hypothetical protein [Blastocatellia bacterium]
MQSILCAHCQSENPHYTKFCLTCGSAITAPVMRSRPSQSSVHVQTSQKSPQTVVSVPNSTETEQTNETQESGNWLKGLKKRLFF